jgi:hypothetical protein
VLLISPFFIMPTVSALIWKNLIFHPVSGILAYGLEAVRRATGGLAGALPDAVDHHHRLVAMAAVRDPDSDDRHAVPGPGTERSRASGRRRARSRSSGT